MRRWLKITLIVITVLLLTVGVFAYYAYDRWAKQPGFNTAEVADIRVYVYPDATWNQVVDSIIARTDAPHAEDLRWLLNNRSGKVKPLVGSYVIEPNVTTRKLYNTLVYGMQSPVQLQFNTVRLPGVLWKRLSQQLLVDSTTISKAMTDTLLLHTVGIQDTTLAYHIIPNTYEVYWNITAEDLVKRLASESDNFWTEARRTKADAIGLLPMEVVNLAAIVQEESAKRDEYPMIAGLYLNRLRSGIRLQSDPTIKFALQEFGLRRILHEHLKVDSPYNTYQNVGLPPTPIRIPSISAIDGVLNAVKHDYIYMCAKADFSGYHAFATTYSQHMKNARAYRRALDERNIK